MATTPASHVDDSVVRLRATLTRLARQLNLSAAALGLTPTQVTIFTAIARHGPVGQSRLADLEGVNPTMLSRVIGKLEAMGLVQRVSDPDDGRCTLVRITAEGRRRHARIREERARWLEARLAELAPERAESLVAALPALEELARVLRDRGGA